MNGPRSSPTHIAARSGARESQAVKRAFIIGATAEIGHSVAKKGASRRFATALQYAAGAVLGLLLDVAFVLFVLWGTTPSRRAIEPNKSVFPVSRRAVVQKYVHAPLPSCREYNTRSRALCAVVDRVAKPEGGLTKNDHNGHNK